MGNICSRYVFNYTREKPCIKCYDTFKPTHGGFSQRRSCREHVFNLNTCIYCGKDKNKGTWNCYHSVY
jgi:hypothetical protein